MDGQKDTKRSIFQDGQIFDAVLIVKPFGCGICAEEIHEMLKAVKDPDVLPVRIVSGDDAMAATGMITEAAAARISYHYGQDSPFGILLRAAMEKKDTEEERDFMFRGLRVGMTKQNVDRKELFKTGDQVKVRDWDSMAREFGTYSTGEIKCRLTFTDEMRFLCGRIAVVTGREKNGSIKLDFYGRKEDYGTFSLTEDMLEKIPEKNAVEPAFRIGDKVRLRDGLKTGEYYGGCCFYTGMNHFRGKPMIISDVEVREHTGRLRISYRCRETYSPLEQCHIYSEQMLEAYRPQ